MELPKIGEKTAEKILSAAREIRQGPDVKEDAAAVAEKPEGPSGNRSEASPE
jgi:hypothetical protein